MTMQSSCDISEVVVYCDGGCWPNPGPAAYAAVVADESGSIIFEQVVELPRATNNEAEYHALILGARLARLAGASEAHFVMDSELVVKQTALFYAVKGSELSRLHSRAQNLLMGFDRWSILWVERKGNQRADWLCNTLLRPDDKRALREPSRSVQYRTDGYARVGWSGVGSRAAA